MRYFNFLIAVAVFLMLLSSCNKMNDIVDSDKNIKSTKFELGDIKGNQETGVIMPLKTGNIWYYKVTDYDNLGNILGTTKTSVKVIGEKTIDNEKWFEVQFPMITDKYPVYMINTDEGLYVQSPLNPEFKGSTFLFAKYPEVNNTFYSGFIIDTINTTSTFLDTSSIWYQSSNQSVTVPKANYTCIKYAGYYKSQDSKIEGKPVMNTFFTPDFGLVKAEIYPRGYDYVRRVYELIENPEADPTDDCVHSEILVLNDIKLGEAITITRSIENTGAIEYKLNGIFISPDKDLISFSNIKPSPGEWLSKNLKPGQSLSFDIKVQPTKTGEFTAIVMILYTNEDNPDNYKCWFGIDIKGNCVE